MEYEKENRKLLDLTEKVSTLDLEAESRVLNPTEVVTLRECKQQIFELEKLARADLLQKSKVKWILDGDENSNFFHNSLKAKNRKCSIQGLMINGNWVIDVESIKMEAWRFFGTKIHEDHKDRPLFQNSGFLKLSKADRIFLEESFDLQEIINAIWECGNDKAPGPDGFSFKFIKKFWSIIQDDVMRFVKHFECFGCLSRGSNSSFITLLPKVKDPLSLIDYRPISLIGCVYKILAKALALRLKRVIGTIIDEVQSAFIENRNILDGLMIINEICTWAKKSKTKTFLFKVDFDKAFDSINWSYLDSVMGQMGFGEKWRFWIRGCLSSSRASVLLNGSATKEFPFTKGVHQGDPLSPFLFIIAMEGLNVALKTAGHKSLFHGVNIPNGGPTISHLFYVDDAIFVGNWESTNFTNLARILRCFHAASGLKVNFHKSKVYGVGTSVGEIVSCAHILGCEAGSFIFKYLGVAVGANMNLKRNWQPVIDRVQNKLSAWKAKTLSFGGRLTLTKAVLGSLPTYYFSLFKAPSSVVDLIERLRNRFL